LFDNILLTQVSCSFWTFAHFHLFNAQISIALFWKNFVETSKFCVLEK
jgi:hypothetical protein